MESPRLRVENLFEIACKEKPVNRNLSTQDLKLNVPHRYDCGGGPGMSSNGWMTKVCFKAFQNAQENMHKREP